MILRALGENPAALDSAGYNVFALRYAYVTFGSIMTAVSGAVVSLAYTNFWSDGMTSGKGWIAVALVVFSAWNPLTATFGALLFGAISIIGIDVQTVFPQVPSQVFSALPYVATIIALIFTTGNFRGRRSAAPQKSGPRSVRAASTAATDGLAGVDVRVANAVGAHGAVLQAVVQRVHLVGRRN